MDAKSSIKDLLYNDKDKVVFVLEELGCHKINPNFGSEEIRCALPDAMNGTSISIKTDEYLNCMVFSRGEYDDYVIKDIITLVQYINKMSFNQAVSWLCELLHIEIVDENRIVNNIGLATELRKLRHKKNKTIIDIKHDELKLDYLNQYKSYIIQEWIEEGITKDIQEKYSIRIDEYRKRWLIPIYNENNQLISIKGRTYIKNYKELDIPKYWYYYKLGYNDILYGLNFNKQHITQKKEIILFEGEKSVMKAESYGYNWCCSVGKCGINPHLKRKILSLHCDVVIAFDKDVSYKDVYKEAKKLSDYTNVFIIYDNNNLLDIQNKDAPVDKGQSVFDILYKNKSRIH